MRYICIINIILKLMRPKFSAALILMYWILLIPDTLHSQNVSDKKILWTTDWSPNGKYIAVAGNTDTLVIYHSESMKIFKRIPFKSTITRVKWHPHSLVLAITSQNSPDVSCILNIDTGQRIELEGISADGARAMDWHGSGQYLVVGDNDGKISIFDINGKLSKTFHHENTKSITGLDWHPSRDQIVTVGDKIRLFNSQGLLIKNIKHRPEEVLILSVAWHPSGDMFVTGDYGDSKDKSLLQYWDQNGNLIKTLNISNGEYRNMVWNKKGDRLATASDVLRIWDQKGSLKYIGTSPDYLWGVSWSPKSKRIVTSSFQQKIRIWDNKARTIWSI
jgi:WD40 repeat protein